MSRRGRTFGDEMPPRRVKRVVLSPPTYVSTIRLARIVFVRINRPKQGLVVEGWERADVTFPSATKEQVQKRLGFSGRDYSRVSFIDVKSLKAIGNFREGYCTTKFRSTAESTS
jgi:hypothetical protein